MKSYIVDQLATDENFTEEGYLAVNPDVAQAVHEGQFESGWVHFNQFGRNEKRKIRQKLGSETDIMLDRNLISFSYLTGVGIEIGALHLPLPVSQTASVKYVDRMSVNDLRKQYPELQSLDLVNVDILDDGETLETFQDATLDFVIANHFLEHCQNPILAVENMIRVLKTSGVLYLAIPDKRSTFDADRPITPLTHVIKDYEAGPGWSHQQHFKEWVKLVNKVTDAIEAKKQIHTLMAMNYSIHFHVWTQAEMMELIAYLQGKLCFDIEVMFYNRQHKNEVIWVLRKGKAC
jgi:predicted SAM-dependent methyltransferase